MQPSEAPMKHRFYQFRSLVTLSLLTVSLVTPCVAASGDWATLPDGRAIIELKSVRVALPSTGPDTELIRFTDRHNIRNEMTLKEVIERPADARRLFESTDLMNMSIPNLMDRSGLFVGKFPRSEFTSGLASFAIGKDATAVCKYWENKFGRLASSLSANDTRLSRAGWAEFELRKSPLSLAYVRRLDDPAKPYFAGVVCGSFKDCSLTKCLTADLAASYGFARKVADQQDWLSLDRKVEDFFKYLFIDL
jgi:hypothetical protein